MNTNNIIPNKLKELRVARGLRQRDIALMLQMQCEDRISKWEKGLAMPNVKNLFTIATALKVLPHQIYPSLLNISSEEFQNSSIT